MLSFANQTIVYKNNFYQLFSPIDGLCIAGCPLSRFKSAIDFSRSIGVKLNPCLNGSLFFLFLSERTHQQDAENARWPQNPAVANRKAGIHNALI
jgi:hypothetical protein